MVKTPLVYKRVSGNFKVRKEANFRINPKSNMNQGKNDIVLRSVRGISLDSKKIKSFSREHDVSTIKFPRIIAASEKL